MKVIIVALALVALAVAGPIDVNEPPKIVRSEFDSQPDGSFVSSFEADNGIVQSAVGEIKQVVNEKNEPVNIVVIRGSYSYPRADGSIEKVEYVADENGFQAQGDSIPKLPARR